MRLHKLEVSAFGPFGGSVTVDFDALGEAGLFLLTGSTGAGKTSLLDAVCFALYGQVPGDRQQAGRLRSDHAPVGAGPRVELDLTVGSRLFRFVRCPAWDRPKARGTGTTLQQATAVVAERHEGGWETLATRIPDVSQLAVTLLGMDVHQFTQVVLLPQGRFQEFLRSGADSRKAVLEQLFGTHRFRDVERWLVSRRQQTGRLDDQHRAAACRLADQLSAIAEVEGPGDDATAWSAWAALTCSDLQQLAKVARVQADEEHSRVRLLQARIAAAERAAVLREQGLTASTTQERQRSRRRETARWRRQLQRAESARDVVALLQPLTQAEQELAVGVQAADRARVDAAEAGVETPDPGSAAPQQLAVLDAQRRSVESFLSTLHEVAHVRRPLITEINALAASQAEVTASRGAVDAELAQLPAQSEWLAAELLQARDVAATLAPLQTQLQHQEAVVAAATALPEATACLARAILHRDAAVKAHNEAGDGLNRLRDQRLAGAAAALAGRLRRGKPCPVCGGCEHPIPAAGSGEVPTEADEVAARATVSATKTARSAAEAEHAEVLEVVLLLQSRAEGQDAAGATAALAPLRTDLRAAEAAATQVQPLMESVRRLDEQASGARQQAHELIAAEASLGERLALRSTELRVLDERLSRQLGERGDLDHELPDLERKLTAIDPLIAAVRTLAVLQQTATAARGHAQAAAVAAGFAAIEVVSREAMSDDDRTALHRRLDDVDRAARQVQETLADAAVQAAMRSDPPDLAAGVEELQHAEVAQRRAVETAGQLTGRAEQADALRADLDSAITAWAPARRNHEIAEAMATLAEGKAADNHLKMSLSAYVLAARLTAVVDAANERLAPMTSGRYTLEHTNDRDAGDRSRSGGGLGLRVNDGWTGQSRDPKTLSGGETFQASLALALGLADVVSHESGGTVMHSLFVDEGFGSLDGDSLDEVMDVLDGLRSGGRVVGVVSHVEALRERVPAQIRVRRGRTGSTVTQV